MQGGFLQVWGGGFTEGRCEFPMELGECKGGDNFPKGGGQDRRPRQCCFRSYFFSDRVRVLWEDFTKIYACFCPDAPVLQNAAVARSPNFRSPPTSAIPRPHIETTHHHSSDSICWSGLKIFILIQFSNQCIYCKLYTPSHKEIITVPLLSLKLYAAFLYAIIF